MRKDLPDHDDEVAQLRRELGEARQQQAATADILRAISLPSFDLDALLATLVETGARLCEAPRGLIWLRGGEQFFLSAEIGHPPDWVAFAKANPLRPTADSTQPAARVAFTGEIFHASDYRIDPRFVPAGMERFGEAWALLSVPLKRDGKVEGVIGFTRSEARLFSESQVNLVRTFADQAVIALENVRLFDEVRTRTRDLGEALQQQTATADVLKVISRSAFDLDTVLTTLVRMGLELCEAPRGMILLRRGDKLVLSAHIGLSAEFIAFHTEDPLTISADAVLPAARAAFTGEVVNISDFKAPSHLWPREVRHFGDIWSILVVPMKRDGKVEGIIGFIRSEARLFTDSQVALVQTFADQAVIAIENARLFEEVQARTRDLGEALQQQTATADVLKVISRAAFDLNTVLNTLVQSAARLCNATQCNIHLRDGEVFRLEATLGHSPDIIALMTEAGRHTGEAALRAGRKSVVSRVIASGMVEQIEDVLADAEFDLGFAASRLGVRAVLGVPLLREGKVEGVFVVSRPEPGRFNDRQTGIVQGFADQAVIAIENVRLFKAVEARTRDLGEALRQQTATADVLKVISRSTFDLDTVLATLLRTGLELCDARRGFISLRKDGKLILSAHIGLPDEFIAHHIDDPPTIGADARMPVPRAAFTGEVINTANFTPPAHLWSRDIEEFGDVWAILVVPMKRDGNVEGVISFFRTEPVLFTDSQVALVQTFADQAVIAIENARLFDEVQTRTRDLGEALRQQTATAEVLKVISRSAFDLDTVLTTLVRTGIELCDASRGLILLRRGDKLILSAHIGLSAEFIASHTNDPLTISADAVQPAARAAVTGEVVNISDFKPSSHIWPREFRQFGDTWSLLVVPMKRAGVVEGVIGFVRSEARLFTEGQVALVQTFADQAVIAIENARLFDEVQARTRELSRSVAELKALGEVGAAVTSSLDLRQVLTTVVAHAVDLAAADAGAIFRYRQSDRTFRLAEAANLDESATAALYAIRIGEETAMGEAVRTGQPVQLPDIAALPSYPVRDAALAAGFHAALLVPLLVPGHALGVLMLQRRKPGLYPAATVELMRTFASQSALAIENARLFQDIAEKSEQLELASQHKSQFLANMSHELRTPLNAILGYTELLTDGIYGDLPDKPRAVLERVQQNGKHLLGLINDVLDLSKIEAGQFTLTIEDYTLPELVNNVMATTESLARNKGLALRAAIDENLPHGQGDSRRLSQVLLNLVGNALKFTDTGEVRIEAALAPDGRFRIAVADTGPGIAVADQQRIFEEFRQVDNTSTRNKGGSGLGLAISTRIVEMHGGTISVASTVGVGSTFTIDLPVRVSQEAAT